eukprot:11969598-Alexandrium_andersonii.AAC.1
MPLGCLAGGGPPCPVDWVRGPLLLAAFFAIRWANKVARQRHQPSQARETAGDQQQLVHFKGQYAGQVSDLHNN